MKNQLTKSIGGLFIAGLLALPNLIQAQAPIVAGHYPAGAEGLKGASLPPPGLSSATTTSSTIPTASKMARPASTLRLTSTRRA